MDTHTNRVKLKDDNVINGYVGMEGPGFAPEGSISEEKMKAEERDDRELPLCRA